VLRELEIAIILLKVCRFHPLQLQHIEPLASEEPFLGAVLRAKLHEVRLRNPVA
jgi:hypothetical protein